MVTTRQIPPENARPAQEEGEDEASEATSQQHEQPQTINPSLLNRSADVSRRLLLENIVPARRPLPQGNDDVIRRPIKAKNADLLIRARGMGKKIWSLEKLQRMLNLLVPEMSNSASAPYGALSGAAAGSLGASRPSEEANIAQLLHKERRNGPSDRDPTVGTQELHRFRGRYIYVYDIDEKVKPIMVREYAKVADNRDGDWPQFRTVSGGKCPFVEEPEAEKESHRQQQAARAAEAAETTAQPAEEDAAKASMAKTVRSVTGKRTLAEMESAQNRGASVGASTATATGIPALDTAQPLNAFTSRAAPARLLAGEPVASGLQQSNVTSAIRSQMISSATGAGGAKAGTSREMHSLLQRKVLQKNSLSYRTPAPLATATTAAGTESAAAAAAALGTAGVRGHRAAEELARTATAAVAGQDAAAVRRRPRLDEVASAGNVRSRKSVVDAAKAEAASMAAPPRPKKRDPKPGYCENCQERFEDFDDVSGCCDVALRGEK